MVFPRPNVVSFDLENNRMRARLKIIAALLIVGVLLAGLAAGQAGRHSGTGEVGKERGMFLNVVATRADGSGERVTAKELALYHGGMEQTIQRFTPGHGPARAVILVD